ncbi:MAG TPA: hypothetical protein VLI55_01060 [Bryobacteraceae bacterium]|nr:hypothetical protein [Bryobacteraceae bacterium]
MINKAVLFFLFSAFTLRAQTFINGQAARAVIGQTTFTGGGSTASQQILGGVSGLAYANNKLFVADSNGVGATPLNNRVMVFDTSQIPAPRADLTTGFTPTDPSCYLCGYLAVNVLGQPNYTGTNPGVTSQSMQTPNAVATDGQMLAVADTNNNRVLIWKSIPSTVNAPPDLVVGQADFTHGTGATSQTSLLGPQGVWLSQDGKLFVADSANNRVLIWNHVPTANNQPADVVLGQSSFTSGAIPSGCKAINLTNTAAANELCNPVSVTSDGVHLFVSDLGFNRVLIWNHIPTSNAQPADVVVGQPDLSGAAPNNPATCVGAPPAATNGPCVGGLNFPRFALSDGTRLFIADGGNNRVLIYNSIPTRNSAWADVVLGQPDFTKDINSSQTISIASTAIDNTGAVDTIPGPLSLAFDGVNLYVSDPYNRRVLVFTPGDTPLVPSNKPVVNWASETVRQEGVVSLALVGTITAKDTVTVTIQSKAYTYTVQSSDTLDTIAQALVTAINANGGDPNVAAIFAGAGTASIYLSSKQTDLGFDAISLAATTSNSSNIVATASGAYLSAGTAATAAPGMLVEINGQNLSDHTSANPPDTGTSPLPTTLFGTQVYMDGIPSPVLKVSPTQVISQVPYNFGDRNSTSIYVRTVHDDGSTTVTNATPVYIAPADPGLFSAPVSPNQVRPWPVIRAYHQPGNPTVVVAVDGTANAGDTATITVNGRAYTYTVKSGDSLTSIVNGLIAAINSAPDPDVTASSGSAFTRVVLTARQGGTAGTGIPVSGTVGSGAKVTLTAYTNKTCCAVQPGSPINPSNPAGPGELITLSAAGLGTLSDPNAQAAQITGQPYSGPTPNTAANSVSATIGGTTAQVVAAGLATGSYGIYQVQMIVPSDAPTNAASQVYIAQNAFVSNIATVAVGPPVLTPPPPPVTSTGPIRISIDRPALQSPAFTGYAAFGGWALSAKALITNVQVSVDGVANGTASYGANRQDVCAVAGSVPGCPNLGWNYLLDTTQFADGTHAVQITATDANGSQYTAAQSFTTSNWGGALPTRLAIDNPSVQGATFLGATFQGWTSLSGWAVNTTAPISAVTVSVDGQAPGAASYGSSSYAGYRPDVCSAYPGPGCPDVGWSYLLDTSALANGKHTLIVTASTADGQRIIRANAFTVANWTTAGNPIHISIDSPSSASAAFSGVPAFGGWAVDVNAPITSVGVAIDGISYGNALYGGNRADVCQVLTNAPGCPNVGWNFAIDTTRIADGNHTLAITARPVTGQSYTATMPFQVSNQGTSGNSTRIAIDHPTASQAPVSGIPPFAGWAINMSAPISTVQLFIDGQPRGTADYGFARPDVCARYAAAGCPGVGWNALVDVTSLTNGMHTLEVTATSTSGQRATSSTAFSVSNTASPGPTSVFISQPNTASRPYLGLAPFSGVASNAGGAAVTVYISIDGVTYGTASPCVPSQWFSTCPGSSWTFPVDTTQLVDGTHTLGATAVAADGTSAIASATFRVANWSTANSTIVTIDTPSAFSAPFAGVVPFGGWALDANSAIGSVEMSVDGIPFGAASYGGNRPDVCAVVPNSPGCPNVGWNVFVNTGTLSNGTHTLGVTATTLNGQSSTATSSFTVSN